MHVIRRVDPNEWKTMSGHAHRAVFDETLPPEYEMIDAALLIIDEKPNVVVGYATIRELDVNSVYLKYGGAFDNIRGTGAVPKAYKALLAFLTKRYKTITTLVQNTNAAYLRLALKFGFVVIGVRVFQGDIFCELLLEA